MNNKDNNNNNNNNSCIEVPFPAKVDMTETCRLLLPSYFTYLQVNEISFAFGFQ